MSDNNVKYHAMIEQVFLKSFNCVCWFVKIGVWGQTALTVNLLYFYNKFIARTTNFALLALAAGNSASTCMYRN